jgi:hypothetical protein
MNRSKYGATPTIVDGIRFDSKLEAKRYAELLALEKAGKISNLTRQDRYPLGVGAVKLGDYVADFSYYCHERGCMIIEDAKGILTPLCRWKLKHMAAIGYEVVLWPPRKVKTRKKRVAK